MPILLLFTNRGRVFKLRGFDVPQMSRSARGYALANLVRLERGEEVTAPIAIRNFEEHFNLVFGTVRGYVKRTALAPLRHGALQRPSGDAPGGETTSCAGCAPPMATTG